MYQPTAPWSAPKAKMPASFGASRAGMRRAHEEIQERNGEREADEPAPQAVQIFPEEDALELGQAHAGVDRAVLRDRLVALELGLPLRLAERRNDRPSPAAIR